jgi:hypothetical protein
MLEQENTRIREENVQRQLQGQELLPLLDIDRPELNTFGATDMNSVEVDIINFITNSGANNFPNTGEIVETLSNGRITAEDIHKQIQEKLEEKGVAISEP